MSEINIPNWMIWARQLQAISQSGMYFSSNDFDRERFQKISAIAAEIMADYTCVPKEKWQEGFTDQKGYATPKVSVRAAVFQDHHILLVHEKLDGLWSMPGGWADLNDPPSKMIEREVWEESGFIVKAVKLIAVHESNHDRHPLEFWHSYTLVFLCDLLGGEPGESIETSECDFFTEGSLPPLSLSRTTTKSIAEAFYFLDHPEAMSNFD